MNLPILITIAIPTYNRAEYLEQALLSALNQTYSRLDIIISNNASSDHTEQIIKKHNDNRIRYYKHEKMLTVSDNWDFCLHKAKGDFFLMLSDDDFLEPTAIEEMFQEIKERDIGFVYCRILYVDNCSNPIILSPSAPKIETGKDFIINHLKIKRIAQPSSILHETKLAKDVGGYINVGSTTDFLMRLTLATCGYVKFIDKPLVKYRMHFQNLTRDLEYVFRSHLQLVKRIENKESPLYAYKKEIIDYCVNFIYRSARSYLLRGNKIPSDTIKILNLLKPRIYWRYLMRIYSFSLVQFLASVRRKLVQKQQKQKRMDYADSQFNVSNS